VVEPPENREYTAGRDALVRLGKGTVGSDVLVVGDFQIVEFRVSFDEREKVTIERKVSLEVAEQRKM
jgi:hypothetical protein